MGSGIDASATAPSNTTIGGNTIANVVGEVGLHQGTATTVNGNGVGPFAGLDGGSCGWGDYQRDR